MLTTLNLLEGVGVKTEGLAGLWLIIENITQRYGLLVISNTNKIKRIHAKVRLSSARLCKFNQEVKPFLIVEIPKDKNAKKRPNVISTAAH